MVQYKKNLVERIGGSSSYEMTAFQLAERLTVDPKLSEFYGQCSVDDLCDLQVSLMDLAIREMSDDTRTKSLDRVTLQHYRLFQSGLNVSHFDSIKNHLCDALQYTWADADVIEDFLQCFEPLRETFYQNGCRRTYCSSDDEEEEFDMPLKKEPTKEVKKMQRSSSGNSVDKTSMKKGTRNISGENLLAMLKLNRNKRSKSTTA